MVFLLMLMRTTKEELITISLVTRCMSVAQVTDADADNKEELMTISLVSSEYVCPLPRWINNWRQQITNQLNKLTSHFGLDTSMMNLRADQCPPLALFMIGSSDSDNSFWMISKLGMYLECWLTVNRRSKQCIWWCRQLYAFCIWKIELDWNLLRESFVRTLKCKKRAAGVGSSKRGESKTRNVCALHCEDNPDSDSRNSDSTFSMAIPTHWGREYGNCVDG